MDTVGFIILVAALAVGIVLFIIFKAPKLAPKKGIVEAIFAASDELFPYRQEIRSLISDSLGLYQQHDPGAFATRRGTVARRAEAIEQNLTRAEASLAAYEKVASQKSFYDLASACSGTLRQVVHQLAELQNESAAIEPIVMQLQRSNTLANDMNMTTYIADDDTVKASRVADHITQIVALLDQTLQQAAALNLQTNEFRQIAASIATALQQAQQEYAELRQYLLNGNYGTYNTKAQALPAFYARLDMSSFESIATTAFTHNPEESFINDLRPHAYS